jgi:acylphosphatase
MVVCKHVRYSGQVQGVGFRYTTCGIAENYAVAGYVRNLPGGDVELVAQGEEQEVKAFLDAVALAMKGYIENTIVRDEIPADYTHFSVRR